MSQRDSGYERVERDSYQTPAWCTMALIPHLPPISDDTVIWEPAAGEGQMVKALHDAGYGVHATDIESGTDFLSTVDKRFRVICTNPPYEHARRFIEHALQLVGPSGIVAMLLRCDFDSAHSRQHLFGSCPAFFKKVILTKRIRWFADSSGSPSFNHCWMIWKNDHKGPPTLAYAAPEPNGSL